MFSRVFRPLLCVFATLFAALSLPVPALAEISEARATELLRVHDLRTSVAFGNRFLKQQALVAVRDVLAKLGRDQQLGKDWKRGQADWAEAEARLAQPLLARLETDWNSLGWLPAQWLEMSRASFTNDDIEALLGHFQSDIGRKQAKLIDHAVAFHVSGAYGLSGRFIQDYPGTEEEQRTLTYVWDEEDREMRFSIASNDNIEGQRFALSPLGAKYQKALIIKLTGILNARIDQVAAAFPGEARAAAAAADPFVSRFKAAAR